MTPPFQLTDDEFRLLTWAGPDFSELTIDLESLERNCPLDNGRLEQPTISKTCPDSKLFDTGNLRAFPWEISLSILILLDLKSLTDFRAVSRGRYPSRSECTTCIVID